METIILIWEMIPEQTRIYQLIVNTEDAKKIKAAHLDYVNAVDETGAADWLCKYLEGKEHLEEKDDEPWIVGSQSEITVVQSGFIM